jgi:hypothetical protein
MLDCAQLSELEAKGRIGVLSVIRSHTSLLIESNMHRERKYLDKMVYQWKPGGLPIHSIWTGIDKQHDLAHAVLTDAQPPSRGKEDNLALSINR